MIAFFVAQWMKNSLLMPLALHGRFTTIINE